VQTASPAAGYRADIDGLRGVAVLVVVLFHLGVPGLPGGFVGVDVFFVISGFLITRLIRDEVAATGRFDFGGFYARRALRILPALLAVIVGCFLFATLLFSPRLLRQFVQEAGLAAVSLSNVLFWQESGYFGPAAETRVLLHTWSLGVEEQFYLLWPLLLVAALRWRSRLALPLTVGVASLSLWLSTSTPGSMAFFLLPFRAHELLAGALLALAPAPPERWRAVAALAHPVGLGMIAASIVLYGPQTPFPGYAALLPVAGACLVIAARSAPSAALLRWRPLVSVGLISYSLYLVHWPLIVFYRLYVPGEIAALPATVIFIIAIVLGWASWRCIETPFRSGAMGVWLRRDRPAAFGIGLAACLTCLGISTIVNMDGWPWRFSAQQRELLASFEQGSQRPTDPCHYRTGRIDARFETQFDACVRSEGPAVIVTGDSHAMDLWQALQFWAASPHVVGVAFGGCRPAVPREDCQYEQLALFIERYREQVAGIVYTQSGRDLVTPSGRPVPAELSAIESFLGRLRAAVPTVVWVGPQYEPRVNPDRVGLGLDNLADAIDPNSELIALDRALAASVPRLGIAYVSKMSVLGPLSPELFIVDNQITYSDLHHWSGPGEVVFGKRLLDGSAPLRALLGRRPDPPPAP
jgi:peptidoglycan/LPS O-acetylase OafA/YrhL